MWCGCSYDVMVWCDGIVWEGMIQIIFYIHHNNDSLETLCFCCFQWSAPDCLRGGKHRARKYHILSFLRQFVVGFISPTFGENVNLRVVLMLYDTREIEQMIMTESFTLHLTQSQNSAFHAVALFKLGDSSLWESTNVTLGQTKTTRLPWFFSLHMRGLGCDVKEAGLTWAVEKQIEPEPAKALEPAREVPRSFLVMHNENASVLWHHIINMLYYLLRSTYNDCICI